MYCTHCGKSVDVDKIEEKKASVSLVPDRQKFNSQVEYVCPRCGHIIHDSLKNEEYKELTRASHAEMQRGTNLFSTGMSFLLVGIIVLAISIIFFRLSMKANTNFQLSTNCMEFYSFIITLIIGVIGIGAGIILIFLGVTRKNRYKYLLRDIQNSTFIQ